MGQLSPSQQLSQIFIVLNGLGQNFLFSEVHKHSEQVSEEQQRQEGVGVWISDGTHGQDDCNLG